MSSKSRNDFVSARRRLASAQDLMHCLKRAYMSSPARL